MLITQADDKYSQQLCPLSYIKLTHLNFSYMDENEE